jgi:hypothetical protein
MKSPAMRSALAPLYAIQDSLKKDWEGAQREAGIEAALSGLDAKEAAKTPPRRSKGAIARRPNASYPSVRMAMVRHPVRA